MAPERGFAPIGLVLVPTSSSRAALGMTGALHTALTPSDAGARSIVVPKGPASGPCRA